MVWEFLEALEVVQAQGHEAHKVKVGHWVT